MSTRGTMLESDATWLVERPIAHRGVHDLAAGRPENSLAAFRRACELGFPVELDVRVTRDNEAVVIHDASLGRLAGADRPVHEMPASQITALALQGTAERIPRLADALDVVAGQVPLLLDLKSRLASPALERVVARALDGYGGHVAVQSFSPISLLKIRMRCAGMPIGQVSGRLVGAPRVVRLLGRSMASNVVVRPDFINYELAALPCAPASFWRRRGLPLLAWTVEAPEQVDWALALADNYLFSGFVPDMEVPGTHGRSAQGA